MAEEKNSSPADRTVVITRDFEASAQTVFDAWLDPKLTGKWLFATTAGKMVRVEIDARVGGQFVFVDRRDGVDIEHIGQYLEIDRPRRLVFTFSVPKYSAESTRVSIDFTPHVSGCQLKLTHEGILPAYLEATHSGWAQILNHLAAQIDMSNTSDREIVITRLFNAPREMVFNAWTDPKQIVNWYGPRGFTDTIQVMDVRPGGEWNHVMHGPHGVDYPNYSIYTEVIKPERLCYSHGGSKPGGPDADFHATVTFEEIGDKTRLTLRMVFPTKAVRDQIASVYGAVEGGQQTFDRLTEFLAGDDQPVFSVTRIFDASIGLVWKAWTEPGRLACWWGPRGFTMLHCDTDLRPGGLCLFGMRSPDGFEMWGKFVYREIARPVRLVFVNSFSDKDGNTHRHFASPTWPLETLTTIDLVEQDGRTFVTLKGTPINATAEERNTFKAGFGSMQKGFSGTMDQLAEYLKEN